MHYVLSTDQISTLPASTSAYDLWNPDLWIESASMVLLSNIQQFALALTLVAAAGSGTAWLEEQC